MHMLPSIISPMAEGVVSMTEPKKNSLDTTREVERGDFEGKTIQSLEILGLNCLRFTFSDETEVILDIEHFGMGVYGIVVETCSR